MFDAPSEGEKGKETPAASIFQRSATAPATRSWWWRRGTKMQSSGLNQGTMSRTPKIF